jgi:hypothetical protein
MLPEISAGPKGATGSADQKVQAYNFRMILSDDPANRIPMPPPPGYDPHRYELLARLLTEKEKHDGHAPTLRDVTLIAKIPNHKADFNNNGPVSTDYIGKSWTTRTPPTSSVGKSGTTTLTTPRDSSISSYMMRASPSL